jgi:hypothetical protein
MDMDYIWLLGPKQFGKFCSRVAIPDSLLYQYQPLDSRIGIHLEIASTVDHDLVSGALQELALLLEDNVFASRLLVMTMNEDYLQNLPFPAGLLSGD